MMEKEQRKDSLGQVFTPPVLASFMISLFKSELHEGYRVLDPCIGPNTFFSLLDDVDPGVRLTGVELDEQLISDDIRQFYSAPGSTLIEGNFFDLPLSEQFDIIVANPPYVRQELLMNGENAKAKAMHTLAPLNIQVPPKSNLYIYFLIKSILHLADNGRLITVIYDSWLYTKFGGFLKEAFLERGRIEGIYHFKKNAFPDMGVGATVIDFRRANNLGGDDRPIKIFSFDTVEEANISNLPPAFELPSQELIDYRLNEQTSIDFSNAIFTPMNKIVTQRMQRGVSPIINKYFIHEHKEYEESIPFVKDVTAIHTFSIDKCPYLLAPGRKLSPRTREYLDFVKGEILARNGKFIDLERQIGNNEHWYKFRLKKPGNILFNYYLRKNIDFLLNEQLHYSSDNFYILKMDNHLLAWFALLNSTFTRIAILRNSRNQGKGLRKIQLYEFKQVPVMDCAQLPLATINKLTKLGEQLKHINRTSVEKETLIHKIDSILVAEYNLRSKQPVTAKQIHKELQQLLSFA